METQLASQSRFVPLKDGRFVPFLALADDGGGHWVTMEGSHVFIGKGETIEKGAAHLVGKTPAEAAKAKSPHGEAEKNRPAWTNQAEKMTTEAITYLTHHSAANPFFRIKTATSVIFESISPLDCSVLMNGVARRLFGVNYEQ